MCVMNLRLARALTAQFCLTIALIETLPSSMALAGPYAPAAGQSGSDAIANTSPLIVAWATSVASITRGPGDITNPGAGPATFGSPTNALGPAEGNSLNVVSLGDGGMISLGFERPIRNGAGADFAVFENSFSDSFLELAFVEVSSDGTNFLRFPSVSLTPTGSQVAGFGTLDPTNLYDLAGKYRQGFGTPLDLAELAGASPLVDVNQIRFVRVIDVVGSINPLYATHDSQGNIVNDPWTTPGASSGFDLDGVAVINAVPEPAAGTLALLCLLAFMAYYWRRQRHCL